MNNVIELKYSFKQKGFPSYKKSITQNVPIKDKIIINDITFDVDKRASANGSSVKYTANFLDTAVVGNDEYNALHRFLLKNDWELC